MIVGLCVVAYPIVSKAVAGYSKKWTAEMPEGKTNDWVQGPKKFPFVKYAPYPFKQSKFREKETKRVTDHIEKVSAFWASQEAGYEAQRAAKKERVRLQQANGFNLPWDEIVMKERAEKGAIWFLMDNSFY